MSDKMIKNSEKLKSKAYIDEMLNMIDSENEDDKSEVTKFFDGCNILITGGTGFLGKLLVEKLLRACPNMGKLFLLMREKKGKTSEERFKEIFEDCLFDPLRKQRSNFIKNVVMIEGDTSLNNLGLSSTSREFLIENTHIVFHAAATVRFDESLRKVVNINVRGTKLMLLLAKQMKNLKVFVHVSTAYSHCPLTHIEEKYYKPGMDPNKAIAFTDMFDDNILEHMKKKVCGPWPNTYAFSKAVGEEIVRQEGQRMPVCIVRPSIMVATYKEPLYGWSNNLYGATGVTAGAFVCILRALHCKETNNAEIIPADYVINNVIVAAWDTGKTWQEKCKEVIVKEEVEPPIYNCVSSCQNPINWKQFMLWNQISGADCPSVHTFWYHTLVLTEKEWIYNLVTFFAHTIPAYVVDIIAAMSGHKPMLVKLYQKIHKFSGVISYFCTREWKFDNKNVQSLWERTNSVDRKKFDFNVKNFDWQEYFIYHTRGLRVYILKDPMSTAAQGRDKYRKMAIIHFTILGVLFLLIAWTLLSFIWTRIFG